MTYISTISHTKGEVIDQCLLRYHYRYNKKYVGENTNEEPLNFGSYIHKIFELGVSSSTVEELQVISEQIQQEYKVPKARSRDTEICLKNFKEFNNKLKGNNIACELHGKIDLAEGVQYEFVIDRVIIGEEGGVLIIDYKTSKREKSKVDLFLDNQLKGYAYAIHELYGIPFDKITCAHYYPLSNNLVTVRYSSSMIFEWKNKQIKKVWRVRKMTKESFFPCENQFCNWCEYKNKLCPKFASNEVIKEAIAQEEHRLEEARLKK